MILPEQLYNTYLEYYITELGYRIPMLVNEVVYFTHAKTSYPRCPRCKVTIEREYMHYCDRCGQNLDWSDYDHATVIRK